MWRELRTVAEKAEATEALIGYDINADGTLRTRSSQNFARAAGQIIVLTCRCPLTMSRVAVAARSTRSCSFRSCIVNCVDGVAASFIARLLQNHRWIAYIVGRDSLRCARDDLSGSARIAACRQRRRGL